MMRIWRMIWAVLVGVGLGGCALKPVADRTQFYVLSVGDYVPVSGGEGKVRIGLSRVQVARYLESPGIVVRERENRIRYSREHHWAESLEHGVANVLVETLRREPVVVEVVEYPVKRDPRPEYTLHVSVLRAEGVISAEGDFGVVLKVRWELEPLQPGRQGSGGVEEILVPWDGRDMERLVAGLSGAVGELSGRVAVELAEFEVRSER